MRLLTRLERLVRKASMDISFITPRCSEALRIELHYGLIIIQ